MQLFVQVFILSLVLGLAKANPSLRIVGGHNAIPNFAPYTVSIQNPDHICAGAIISEKFVLTTADCVGDLPLGSVLAGSQKLLTNLPKIPIKNAIRHPDYDDYGFMNNIALIELETPLTFSTQVAKIDLNRGAVKSGVVTTVTGWGVTESHSLPNDMQVLYEKSLSYEDCHKRFEENPDFKRGLVCAFIQRGQGICDFDEGAPLVANNKLIGIANYAFDCKGTKPDIYADVAHYYEWIQSVLKQ